MSGIPDLDFELTTLSSPSSFSTGTHTHTQVEEEEEDHFQKINTPYIPPRAKPAKEAKERVSEVISEVATATVPPAELTEVQSRLASDGPGWCVLTFAALAGARVVVVRDLPPPEAIPAAAANLPRYTLPELAKLALAGPVEGAAMLRTLHELRRLGPAEGWSVASVEPVIPARQREPGDDDDKVDL